MTDLSKNRCVYCGMGFDEGEAVVYCPVCGTPVHRACWLEHGKCPNEELHAEGFQWKSAAEVHYENENGEAIRSFDASGEEADEVSEADLDEEKYMGVSERELSAFIGVKSVQGLYRLEIMKNIALTRKKMAFNIFSGILRPYYQLYKGMYALGAAVLFLEMLMAVPQMLYMFGYYTNNEQIINIVNGSDFYILTSVVYYVELALMIVLSLYGDYLYLRFAVRRIISVRKTCTDTPREEYFARLVHAGGTSWFRVIQGVVVQIILLIAMFLIFNGFISG